MKAILFFFLLAMPALAQIPVFPVAKLANATRADVETALGKPYLVTPILRTPAEMPGEYLEYEVPKTSGVTVRMKSGKLAQVSVTCNSSSMKALVRQLGFEKAPEEKAGGTPIMKVYSLEAPNGTKWELKATLSQADSPFVDLLNLKPL